jgi:hypothetical protein
MESIAGCIRKAKRRVSSLLKSATGKNTKSVWNKRVAIPATGMILGVGGIPQQAIFEIDLQGKFSKIRKLVQVCTACYYCTPAAHGI